MKIEFEHFPFFEFAGTEKEIGRQYGEAMRDEFRHMVGKLELIVPQILHRRQKLVGGVVAEYGGFAVLVRKGRQQRLRAVYKLVGIGDTGNNRASGPLILQLCQPGTFS